MSKIDRVIRERWPRRIRGSDGAWYSVADRRARAERLRRWKREHGKSYCTHADWSKCDCP